MPLQALEHLRNEAALQVGSVRSLAAFRQCLSQIEHQWPAGIRRELLTLLGTTITSLDMSERQPAIDDFLASTRAHVNDEIRQQREEGGQPSALTELFKAAELGPQALGNRQKEVCKRKGEAAILNGGNAQEVAAELGILPQRLEQISARKGTRERPAGPAYRAVTESDDRFQAIMNHYGIVDARIKNQLREIHRSPETAVGKGKNVQRVASDAGITDRNRIFRLQEQSIRGPAGNAVRGGMSPEAAAHRYGVTDPLLQLRLRDIAQRHEREAQAQQPLLQRLLRGAGTMILRAARFVVESEMEEPARRTAARVMRRMPGELAGPSGTATYVANGIRQFTRNRQRALVDQEARQHRIERALVDMERATQRLPMRNRLSRADSSSDSDSE
jgi:hypothetical protein